MPTATIEGPMHPLTRDVIYATALRREIAKHAIACVLLYLRSAIPAEDTGQVVDSVREQVTAALRNGDNIDVIEQLVSLEEQGCSNINVLLRKLLSLGLDRSQVVQLVNVVITYTETLAGVSRANELHQILPALSEVFERLSQSAASCS